MKGIIGTVFGMQSERPSLGTQYAFSSLREWHIIYNFNHNATTYNQRILLSTLALPLGLGEKSYVDGELLFQNDILDGPDENKNKSILHMIFADDCDDNEAMMMTTTR